MENILPWSPLIKRLRLLLELDQLQFAEYFGVDQRVVDRWERGIMVPEKTMQKAIRDKLHTLEPTISVKAIEAMPVISAIHYNNPLALCCVASQPYADTFEMRARELRYLMVHHMWNKCIEQAADALASDDAWKSSECACVECMVQHVDGHWLRWAGSPIGRTNMSFWIGELVSKPEHLEEGGFDLTIVTLDDVVSDTA